MNEHRYTNRLINEKSPYLLQHAHNPVNWYPWGEEAFEQARSQDKPIFLSIGYSTCHWCHVMAQESFEKEQIAEVMNEHFINVKVDREELPEVDALYIEFAQSMMGGVAGWPLNLVLTPDLEPFFAATYLPPKSIRGMIGMQDMIEKISEAWKGQQRHRMTEQASNLVKMLAENIHYAGSEMPTREQVANGTEVLFKMADPIYGGINGIPKFPIGYQANLLLRYSRTRKESRAMFLVERTLEMMYRGGVYDHLGGGFSRYSIDEKWLVPHFEKMLYDNALLSHSYLEAFLATEKTLYQQAAREIVDFFLRDMAHAEGGFFSAVDADTEGKEGFFYTWTVEEIENILEPEEAHIFCQFYGVSPIGNFQGRNILNMSHSIENFAVKHQIDVERLQETLHSARHRLWEAREQRVHPSKDCKIVTGWNGLAIFALAEVGAALGEERYIHAAERAAHFIKDNIWKDNKFHRRWCDGEARFDASLEDYAYFVKGLLSLFEVGCGVKWLEWALTITALLQRDFKTEGGAFFQTDGQNKSIVVRRCHFTDGAEPSGNAVHCENLLRLYELTLEEGFCKQAEDILKAIKDFLDYYPPGYCYHLLVIERYWDQNKCVIVVALNEQEEGRDEISKAIFSLFIPHKAVIWRRMDDERLLELLPFLKEQGPIDNKTTVYICRQGVCQPPITDLEAVRTALQQL